MKHDAVQHYCEQNSMSSLEIVTLHRNIFLLGMNRGQGFFKELSYHKQKQDNSRFCIETYNEHDCFISHYSLTRLTPVLLVAWIRQGKKMSLISTNKLTCPSKVSIFTITSHYANHVSDIPFSFIFFIIMISIITFGSNNSSYSLFCT